MITQEQINEAASRLQRAEHAGRKAAIALDIANEERQKAAHAWAALIKRARKQQSTQDDQRANDLGPRGVER